MNTGIRAGFAETEITPQAGALLSGYAARSGPCTGVHDPLHAKVMVVEDGETLLAVVALDLVGIRAELVAQVRGELVPCGFAPSGVFIAATHTHSGPETLGLFGQPMDPAYLAHVAERIVAAVKSAQARCVPVTVTYGSGYATVGKNRRSSGGTTDPEVGVLVFRDGDGALPGLLVNYACHPTVLGAENLLVTADYPGFLARKLGDRLGAGTSLFLNGACGDINIGYSADQSALGVVMAQRSFEGAAQVADELAEAVVSAVAGAHSMSSTRLGRRSETVDLPLRRLPAVGEAAAELKAAEARLQEGLNVGLPRTERDRLKLAAIYARIVLENAASVPEGRQSLPVELQALRIGEALMLGIPGELFAETGLAVKKASPAPLTLVAGYANDYVGYLPTRSAFASGGYEVETSRFTPDVADVVERAVGRLADREWRL